MAIELPDELIQLQRAAVAARGKAVKEGYSPEAWRPWLDAAEKVQAAVTAWAEATGASRYEVEMAVKKAGREG